MRRRTILHAAVAPRRLPPRAQVNAGLAGRPRAYQRARVSRDGDHLSSGSARTTAVQDGVVTHMRRAIPARSEQTRAARGDRVGGGAARRAHPEHGRATADAARPPGHVQEVTRNRNRRIVMAKAYWIACYRAVKNPEALAACAKLSGRTLTYPITRSSRPVSSRVVYVLSTVAGGVTCRLGRGRSGGACGPVS
jgi:hypothetical protein